MKDKCVVVRKVPLKLAGMAKLVTWRSGLNVMQTLWINPTYPSGWDNCLERGGKSWQPIGQTVSLASQAGQ